MIFLLSSERSPRMAHPVCINAGDDRAHRARPAVYGGPRTPRCATCESEEKKRRKTVAKASRVLRVYSLPEDERVALKAWQGGRCYICQVATGRTKELAVDHDHGCCPGPTSCGRCIRALCCGPCNQLLGRWNSPAKLARAAKVLLFHPAQHFLRAYRAGTVPPSPDGPFSESPQGEATE